MSLLTQAVNKPFVVCHNPVVYANPRSCLVCGKSVVFVPELCKHPGQPCINWLKENEPYYIPDHTYYWYHTTLEPFCSAKCSLKFSQNNNLYNV